MGGEMMEKDKNMNVHVTKNGYKYYTPQNRQINTVQPSPENKLKKGLSWLGQVLLAGIKNLESSDPHGYNTSHDPALCGESHKELVGDSYWVVYI